MNFDPALVAYESAEIGAVADAAGKDLDVNALPGESAMRITLTSLFANPIDSGRLVTLFFRVQAGGEAVFTAQVDRFLFAPPAANDAITFGRGHPDEPLIIGVEGR